MSLGFDFSAFLSFFIYLYIHIYIFFFYFFLSDVLSLKTLIFSDRCGFVVATWRTIGTLTILGNLCNYVVIFQINLEIQFVLLYHL